MRFSESVVVTFTNRMLIVLVAGISTKDKLTKFSNHTKFFDRATIEKMLIKARGSELWFLLNFVMWYEKWVEKI